MREGVAITERPMPGWLRALDIFLGFLAIILAVIVWIFPGAAVLTLALVVALGLLFMGVSGLARGASFEAGPGWLRALSVIFGVIAIAVAFLAIFFPGFGVSLLISLLAFGLLINGIALIAQGAPVPRASGPQRALNMVAGVLVIAFSLVILAFPSVGLFLLVVLLSVALLFNGIGRIASGITGVRRERIAAAPRA